MDVVPTSGDAHVNLLRRDSVAAADAAVAALFAAARDAKRAAMLPTDSEGDRRRTITRAARALTRASLVAADCRTAAAHSAMGDGSRTPRPLVTGARRGGNCRPTDAQGMRVAAAAAADALVSAAQFETNLCAAVLYERAAWRYYAGGLCRKAALHLVMAGHRYRACGCVDVHAVECYVAARAAFSLTYEERKDGNMEGWPRIDVHVEYALGRQLEALGYHALGLRCTVELLASARPPPDRHALLIQAFVNAARAHPSALAHAASMLQHTNATTKSCGGGEDIAVVNATLAAPPDPVPDKRVALDNIVVVGLTLPVVVHDTVIISMVSDLGVCTRASGLCWARKLASILNAERHAAEGSSGVAAVLAASARARVTAEATVAGDAADVQAHRESPCGTPSLSGDNVMLSPCEVWPRWCGRAEAIDVDVVLRNPLATSLELTDVHVVCTLDVGRDAARQLIPVVPVTSNSRTPLVPRDTFLAALVHLADVHDAAHSDGPVPWLSEHIRLTLPAGGRTSGAGCAVIRLRCGAAAAGTLRIVGIRWRLLGAIWGAVAFQRCGPRLCRTREERSRSARAPDASLAVHVVGDLPRIVTRIVDTTISPATSWPMPFQDYYQPLQTPLNVLDGEIRHARIDVANVGRAPAADLVCRATTPWLALARPLGATGVAWIVSSANLPPGAKTSVPGAVRIGGVGSCTLRAVLQYAPAVAVPEITPPRCWPPPGDSDPEGDNILQRAVTVAHSNGTTSACTRVASLIAMYTISPSLLIRVGFRSSTCTDSGTRIVALELTRSREEIDDSVLIDTLTIDRIFAINRPTLANALDPAGLRGAEIDVGVALARRERLTLQCSVASDGDAPLEASFGCPLSRRALCAAINAAHYENAVAVARTARVKPSPLRTIQAVRRAARTVTAGLHDHNANISLVIEWHCKADGGAFLVGQHHMLDV